jgi:hypothetical protein
VRSPQWDVPIPVDAGEQRIAASAPGCKTWTSVVAVHGEGKAYSITIPQLECTPLDAAATNAMTEQPPSPPPSAASSVGTEDRPSKFGTQRTLAIVSGAIGMVGIGIGTGFAVQSMSKHDEANNLCKGQAACPSEDGVRAGKDAQSAGNIATVGMVVGAAGLVGGLVLWFTAPSSHAAVSARLAIGPGSLHLMGQFE